MKKPVGRASVSAAFGGTGATPARCRCHQKLFKPVVLMRSPAYDCLIYNALVLTMAPGALPLTHGYVAVSGGKIAAVGQAEALQDLPAARERLDARGALLLPGLVNTHCHAPMVWF